MGRRTNAGRGGQQKARRGGRGQSSNSRQPEKIPSPVPPPPEPVHVSTLKLTTKNCTLCDSSLTSQSPYDSILDKYFESFCTFLNITMSDEFAWNFKKENFPFCTSCINVLKSLTNLYELLEKTHYEISEHVDKIKGKVVRACISSNFKDVDMSDLNRGEKRVYFMRRQIVSDDDLESEHFLNPPPEPETKFVPTGQNEDMDPLLDSNSVVETISSVVIDGDSVVPDSAPTPENDPSDVEEETGNEKSLFDRYVEEQLQLLDLQEEAEKRAAHEAEEVAQNLDNDEMDIGQDNSPDNSPEHFDPNDSDNESIVVQDNQDYKMGDDEIIDSLLVNLVQVPRPNWQIIQASHGGFDYGGIKMKYDNRKYSCSTCSATLSSKDAAVEHLELEHLGTSHWYPCEICWTLFKSLSILRDHVRAIHNTKAKRWNYKCNFCFKYFYTEKMRVDHIRAHDQLIKASEDSAGEQMERLFRQGVIYSDGVFKCLLSERDIPCPLTFDNLLAIETHIRKEHKDLPRKLSRLRLRFMCGACGHILEHRMSIVSHFNRVHQGQQAHNCTFCSLTFMTLPEIMEHHKTIHRNEARENLCRIYLPEDDEIEDVSQENGATEEVNVEESTGRRSLRPRSTLKRKYVDPDVVDLEENDQDADFNADDATDESDDDEEYMADDVESLRVEQSIPSKQRKRTVTVKPKKGPVKKGEHRIKYSCGICGQQFPTKDEAAVHYKEPHFADNFNCGLCHKEFTNKEQVLEHLNEHNKDQKMKHFSERHYVYLEDEHGNFIREKTDVISKSDLVSKICCAICTDEKVKDMTCSEFSFHVNSHEEDKPIKCLECETRTNTYSSAFHHYLTYHEENMPFHCLHCKEVFPGVSIFSFHFKESHLKENQSSSAGTVQGVDFIYDC